MEGKQSSQCPVCSGAQLLVKKLDLTLCPFCREGHITRIGLESKKMFCPVCRSRSLGEEKRKWFGLAFDLWWVCPGCSAEFDVVMGGRAKLVKVKEDPLGVGREYLGQTLPIAAWKQLAPLSEAYWKCDRCLAEFFELADSRLVLDWIENDPLGLRDKLFGKAYFRTFWTKLANGISTKSGNTHCPSCNATFDYDQVDSKLRLLDCDWGRFPRLIALLGQLHHLKTWSLFAAGKNSLLPGTGFFLFSTFLYQSRPKLFKPLILSSARGSDGGPRRFTEVMLNEQPLPVASMKSSSSQDATSATRAKTSLAALAAVAILASMAARIVAFRSNLTPEANCSGVNHWHIAT